MLVPLESEQDNSLFSYVVIGARYARNLGLGCFIFGSRSG
jgi:hypothetical protein